MRSSHLDPDEVRCSCGRSTADANAFSYSSSLVRYVFRRCGCGQEWTERQPMVDQTRPVTFDELLDVHERLAGFEGPLNELLGLKSA
jgi:hypothetical protein